MFSEDPGHWIQLTRQEVEDLPEYARQLVHNYCVYDTEHYYIESHGFKKMDLSCFINHSDQPNLMSVEGGHFLEASRDIAAGEELFLDYGEIVPD